MTSNLRESLLMTLKGFLSLTLISARNIFRCCFVRKNTVDAGNMIVDLIFTDQQPFKSLWTRRFLSEGLRKTKMTNPKRSVFSLKHTTVKSIRCPIHTSCVREGSWEQQRLVSFHGRPDDTAHDKKRTSEGLVYFWNGHFWVFWESSGHFRSFKNSCGHFLFSVETYG